MSETVFADSFFYLGLLNPSDEFHEPVCKWSLSYHGAAVTTEAVLLELGDAFCEPGQRQVLLRLVKELRSETLVEIVSLTPDLIQRAWRLFAERGDKGLTDALTGNHHFAQAGFRALFADRDKE